MVINSFIRKHLVYHSQWGNISHLTMRCAHWPWSSAGTERLWLLKWPWMLVIHQNEFCYSSDSRMSCWLLCKVRTVWMHWTLKRCISAFPLCWRFWIVVFLNGRCKFLNVFFAVPFTQQSTQWRTQGDKENILQAKQSGGVDLNETSAAAVLSVEPTWPPPLISPCCIVCSCVARIAYRAALSSGCVFVCECLQQEWEEGD